MRRAQKVPAAANGKLHSHDQIPSPDPNLRKASIAEEFPLVQQAREGDGEAFELLVRPHVSQAFRMARRITRNREDAEDAAQQGLMKAFANIRQFHGEAHFSSWLYRIVMNEALMKVRKRRYEAGFVSLEPNLVEKQCSAQVEGRSETLHPENLYERSEAGRLLRDGIAGLRSTSRAVIWLLGLQERPTRETAKILSLSESAVKTRYLRARLQLRSLLEPHFKKRQAEQFAP